MTILDTCYFETERLLVKEWHSFSPCDWQQQELAHVVASMLTEPVTRALPPDWQGNYSLDRALEWIRDRDDEGTTLLVVDRLVGSSIGLIILFEMPSEADVDHTDVRLGYLLSEDVWGKRIASELLRGFVDWCREHATIASISGGVASDNHASIRVLEKNGFHIVQCGEEISADERLYRLDLR